MMTAASGAEAARAALYQIAYSPQTLAEVEEGYGLLDNLANPRPDWYEYWPIRRFLLGGALDEDCFYGFFSTKFRRKTGLSHADVCAFVGQHAAGADVVLFSPQADMGALFLNVFEQAEAFDTGMIETFDACLARLGRAPGVASLVMDSRQVAFSNYFVARPAFWRAWLELNEALFAIAEDPGDALGAALRAPTLYAGGAQRKVFLIERSASYLLSAEPRWRPVRYNPFRLAWSASALSARPVLSVISDALKLACREFGDAEYLAAFAAIRDEIVAGNATASEPGFGFLGARAEPVPA